MILFVNGETLRSERVKSSKNFLPVNPKGPDISLDVLEAISIRKVKLKNSGKLNLCRMHFTILECSGELSFLVTASQTEPYLTGCIGEQHNFEGIISPLQENRSIDQLA